MSFVNLERSQTHSQCLKIFQVEILDANSSCWFVLQVEIFFVLGGSGVEVPPKVDMSLLIYIFHVHYI
jgi:hypothetical protein